MKVSQIRVYQSLNPMPGSGTSYIDHRYNKGTIALADITLEQVDNGVVVTSKCHKFLVPWNNLVFVSYVVDNAPTDLMTGAPVKKTKV